MLIPVFAEEKKEEVEVPPGPGFPTDASDPKAIYEWIRYAQSLIPQLPEAGAGVAVLLLAERLLAGTRITKGLYPRAAAKLLRFFIRKVCRGV
jgi:hypothetical protein